MSRRLLPLLAATLALGIPVAPALAGEDPDTPSSGPDGSATLHAPSSCRTGHRVKAWVAGTNIDTVAFYVNGKLVGTDSQAGSAGRFRLSMACSQLRLGANTARAVAAFTAGASPARSTMRFQVTRLAQASPRFTG